MAHTFTISAFVIIFDAQQRVLLCHRRDMNLWNLPGGGVIHGELPTEAAERETLEETGLHIEIDRLVGIYAKPNKKDLAFVFEGSVISGVVTTTDEADKVAYFEVKDIPLNTSPGQVAYIDDSISRQTSPFFRHQTTPSSRTWSRMFKRHKRKSKGS